MTTISRRRGSPRRRRSHDDPASGAVTAEIAAALPALVVIVVGAVWLVAIALAQIRCADAAREAATVAPDRASVQVHIGEDAVTVDVSARVPVPLPFGADLPAPTVHARAAAVLERP